MSIDSINKCDGKCFKYVRTVALNHKETGKGHKEYQNLSLSKRNLIEME